MTRQTGEEAARWQGRPGREQPGGRADRGSSRGTDEKGQEGEDREMISSTANKQVRQVVELAKKARVRREEGLYVVEGVRMCRELEPEKIRALYVSESFLASKEHRDFLSGLSWEPVTDTVMKVMADTQTPQGILALVRQDHYTLSDLLSRPGEAHLLLLETIQDPGNLGTILRAGEGAGITGIVMDRATVDIYNPKVIRSTMGSIFRVPFVYVEDLKDACAQLKAAGIPVLAAHLRGELPYDRADLAGPFAFLIGNEARGLREETAALADILVRIPMEGQVESLNAAVAASILMFEAARQRRSIRKK